MIRIVADTTSTLNTDDAKKLGVFLLPQMIIFGEQEFRDDFEITSDEFLKKLKLSPILPKTAAPSPSLYTPIYEEILSSGDVALVLCPSSKVSGTFRSATVAANDFPSTNIHIVDTGIIGPALDHVIRVCLEMSKKGETIGNIIQWVTEKCQSLKIYFYVNTLEYLYKGGRIGGAAALFGSVLQIKPILLFKDGQVNPFETQRTKKKAFSRIAELVKQECPSSVNSNLSILQSDAMEDAIFFKDEFQISLKITDISITNLPPAIVVHAGPGVVALSFFTK